LAVQRFGSKKRFSNFARYRKNIVPSPTAMIDRDRHTVLSFRLWSPRPCIQRKKFLDAVWN